MVLMPMACDIDPSTDPHVLVTLDMLNESSQSTNATRLANDPTVQSNAHHLRLSGTLGIKHIKAVSQVLIKIIGGGEAIG